VALDTDKNETLETKLYGIRVNTSPSFPVIGACGADGQQWGRLRFSTAAAVSPYRFGRLPLHHP